MRKKVLVIIIIVVIILLGIFGIWYFKFKGNNSLQNQDDVTDNIEIENSISDDKEELINDINKDGNEISEESTNTKQEENGDNKTEINNVKQNDVSNKNVETSTQSKPSNSNNAKPQTQKETTTTTKPNSTSTQTSTEQKQETTQNNKVERCTNNNNHGMSVGNSGRWFNTKDEAIAYYNEKTNYWSEWWNNADPNDEKADETYYKNCPSGYEYWSCMYCSKWTINFYYR